MSFRLDGFPPKAASPQGPRWPASVWSTRDGASRLCLPLSLCLVRHFSWLASCARGRPRPGSLAVAPQLWPINFALALPRQRLCFAPALLRRRPDFPPALSQRRLGFSPGLASCPGCQHIGLSGGGSLSLASCFPGQGWCSAHEQQRSPSHPASTPGSSDFLHVGVRNHRNHVRKPVTVKVSGVASQRPRTRRG